MGEVSTQLTPFERELWDENLRLREEVRNIYTRPIPDSKLPGHDVWRALMEDARERGEIQLAVRLTSHVEVEWESTP